MLGEIDFDLPADFDLGSPNDDPRFPDKQQVIGYTPRLPEERVVLEYANRCGFDLWLLFFRLFALLRTRGGTLDVIARPQ